jgi:hypothetical protein
MNSGLLQVFPSCNSHVHAAFRWFDRAFLFKFRLHYSHSRCPSFPERLHEALVGGDEFRSLTRAWSTYLADNAIEPVTSSAIFRAHHSATSIDLLRLIDP